MSIVQTCHLLQLKPKWFGALTGLLFIILAIGTPWTPSVAHNGLVSSLLDSSITRSINKIQAPDDHLYPRLAATSDVQFDNYSLILRGQRVFIYSGEFHTFRLPVPSLWPDILQKVKAAGMNAVSVYVHMGLVNPSPGVVDFDGFRSLQSLFDAAREAGVWVILRPGPYINGETTAGGIPHWITAQIAGTLRTDAPDWRAAWQDYIQGIIEVTAPNQIDSGGPVIAIQIDNEYFQSTSTGNYFAELEAAYKKNGIVVPLTYNDPGQHMSFINGTGAVNIYGLDSYPGGFNCSNPNSFKPVVTNYHAYHEQVNPSQPWYFPEFQGGSFDPWGPNSPGYDACRSMISPSFQSVHYLNLWASNAKLINFYMLYGGTSWGGIPFPGVYTSYDYGASIKENRALTPKFDELKRQALFLRSSPEFAKTDWIADSSSGLEISTNSAAFVSQLRNPDFGSQFFVVRQASSTSTATITFKLNVTTSEGALQIPLAVPSITLGGHESKVIVTDYTFGASSKAMYSTSPIFFSGSIGGRDILFLHGNSSQAHEAALRLTGTGNRTNSSFVQFTTGPAGTVIGILPGAQGIITIWDSSTQLVLFADSDTAATFWAPVISGPSSNPQANFWSLGTNQSVLVGGPYLVRNATITGSVLALYGDLQASVKLSVVAPNSVTTITWNGQMVKRDAASSLTLSFMGGFVGSLTISSLNVTVPTLTGWKFQDSLPEVQHSFNDSLWTVANHTTTNVPQKPMYGDGRILYGCDYGFCENVVIWRGHFNATGLEKSVNLSINGGEAFAASVWLNNIFLMTSFGNSTDNINNIEQTDNKFTFPAGAIIPGQDNVITVVQDNMGLTESGSGSNQNSSKSPRGICGFKLDTGVFSEWKVQGKVGGYNSYPDKVRGVLNEGGLFGERNGWHLPGFSTAGWASRELYLGLPNGAAGVGFFVTTIQLNVPQGLDAMMSFTFNESLGQPYRALLFVNGWMMGKRIGNLGPQAKFPVHEGILNYHGVNTIAVALWAMIPNVTVSPDLQLTVDAVFEGGVGGVTTNNPVWSSSRRS